MAKGTLGTSIKQAFLVVAIVGGATWVLLSMANTDKTGLAKRVVGPVLVMKDLDELRFTNDSDEELGNCMVTIDGGFDASLSLLKPRGRGVVERSAFGDVPRDEFYTRVLRKLAMTCLDEQNNTVAVELK